MSGNSTGQVLSATTSTAGVALLPSTGDGTLIQILTIVTIAAGVAVFISFSASRLYRKYSK